eukprot:comp8102_c0_seq1/m.3585 comp8102_c0_seq1/g.3585  ORF comp8102_c0_seq1/g.3585 comp8102_c0_seq1/m.3585 type:complete len:143 (-) comp8102_c0_seq1:103-531(-)
MRSRPNSVLRKARFYALTKGFRGRAKNVYSVARNRLEKALQYAYISRRLKKRDFRSLWITRISGACREHGLSYAKFMHGLVQNNIQLNRKILSQLAIHEPATFKALTQLVQASKQQTSRGLAGVLDAPASTPFVVGRAQVTA